MNVTRVSIGYSIIETITNISNHCCYGYTLCDSGCIGRPGLGGSNSEYISEVYLPVGTLLIGTYLEEQIGYICV